jgi:hypothetical protein
LHLTAIPLRPIAASEGRRHAIEVTNENPSHKSRR